MVATVAILKVAHLLGRVELPALSMSLVSRVFPLPLFYCGEITFRPQLNKIY